MGKTVRLIAGVAGLAPALGLATAVPATAAPAGHAPGKKVSLQAGQTTTGCTGHFSKVDVGRSNDLIVSASVHGSCVLGIQGVLRINESPGSLSGDRMHAWVTDHGTRVFTGQATFFDSSGSVRANELNVGVIGHRVCAEAFSRAHPNKRIAGPVCVKV